MRWYFAGQNLMADRLFGAAKDLRHVGIEPTAYSKNLVTGELGGPTNLGMTPISETDPRSYVTIESQLEDKPYWLTTASSYGYSPNYYTHDSMAGGIDVARNHFGQNDYWQDPSNPRVTGMNLITKQPAPVNQHSVDPYVEMVREPGGEDGPGYWYLNRKEHDYWDMEPNGPSFETYPTMSAAVKELPYWRNYI